MPPTIAAIDGQTGNASRGQEAGEFGEFCKIELFGTNLRIEVESGECGYRPCARYSERKQETVGESLTPVREGSLHDRIVPIEVLDSGILREPLEHDNRRIDLRPGKEV